MAHWITPAEHCGDALTYIIRDAETGELLKRSVMRAVDKDHLNFRSVKDVLATSSDDESPPPLIDPSKVGETVVESPNERVTSSGMPLLLSPNDVIGKNVTCRVGFGIYIGLLEKIGKLAYTYCDYAGRCRGLARGVLP